MSPAKRSRPARARSPKPVVASEVAPGVFVGGWREAVAFRGTRFCVLDDLPEEMPEATHVRIYDAASGRADLRALDRLANAARDVRATGSPILFFCGHGAMRSPLAAVWYLHRTEGIPVDVAYERVHAQRRKAVAPGDWLANADELRRA